MFNIFKKKKVEEIEEVDESLVEKVKLECTGAYNYLVEKEQVIYHYKAHTVYQVKIPYTVYVTLEDELESTRINGEFSLSGYTQEDEAYAFILKYMESEGNALMEELKSDVLIEYRKHLAEKNTEKLKKLLKDNKPIEINFTIEMNK